MVGVAMPFAFEKRLASGTSANTLLPKVIKRTAILFLIGYLLGAFPRFIWEPSYLLFEARIPGVLQRIAICYFVVSLAVLYLNTLGRIIFGFSLLIIYWLAMAFFSVPGYGSGIYEPYGNFAWWLDNQLLFGRTWPHVPAKGFDPEGLWSTLPAILTTLMGYFTGQWIRLDKQQYERLAIMLISGALLLGLAYSLSVFQPINKQLWTIPYVFLTSGLALIFLSIFYYIIDIKGWKTGTTPLLVFGTNAIFAYVLSSAGAAILNAIQVNNQSLKSYIFDTFYLSWLSPINASLLMGLTYVLVCFLIIFVLYKQRIYIRV